MATMKALQPLINHQIPVTRHTKYRLTPVHASYREFFPKAMPSNTSNPATRLAQSLNQMLHQQIESIHAQNTINQSNMISILEGKSNIPVSSPKENMSEKWREFHGSNDWDTLLDPIHPSLRQEIIKYGEFAQATYDAYDFDAYSEYCGSCRYNRDKLFDQLGLSGHGYNVTKYIYAMSCIELPRWLETSQLAESWSKHSNWMGYVAVSDDDESRRIGRRDIVVVWRGTVSASEWYEDFQNDLEGFGFGDAKVVQGFLSIYASKCNSSRYNKSSASEQVMEELAKLINFYQKRGEEVSITITGHSLGGALALLNAYEAAATFADVHVSVISFAAPRVGNSAFRDELQELGVKTLRVVLKQDVIPCMPGTVFNECLQNFEEIAGGLEWVYTHVGVELKLDGRVSPYLKRGLQLQGHHMLETYLHLLDAFQSSKLPFRPDAKRDIALVNKETDLLVNELKIPPRWYQVANKGLVRNSHGRWVKPKRDLDDIPSPNSNKHLGSGFGVQAY
ncbi:phospholipase A1-Igamma1, chloroplastic-like [Silene latifolia]|uniref:phospholipase A1-Igamma1, chloroplastic-like n=1 Tax=Silene latifolia TaxID=37657 RepID=UPI003D788478